MNAVSRKIIATIILAFVALAALIGLETSPISLKRVLSHPFESLWGTQRQFQDQLLEASGNIDPLLAAGRRLLKPLGPVQLKRVYPAPAKEDSRFNAPR